MAALIRQSDALDMFVQWTKSSRSQAAFHSGIEDANGTVRVMGAGVWREADADLYFEQQRRIVDEARRRFGPLKVFFDVREWIVENPQSAIQFQQMNAEIYKPEDRLVAVVTSSVDKEPPRVALSVGTREVFISMKAAETWLQAYSTGGRLQQVRRTPDRRP
jgi:hypothetical protein